MEYNLANIFNFFGNTPESVVHDSILGSESNSDNIDYSIYDELNVEAMNKDTNTREGGKLKADLRIDTQERKERYKEYKMALKDPIIGQAVEMMADDATQFDVEREFTVWVDGEKKDEKYVKALNSVIKRNIEPFIDSVASRIVGMGEFIYKVSNSDEDVEAQEIKGTGFKDLLLTPYKKIENIHQIRLNGDKFFFATEDITGVSSRDQVAVFESEYNYLHFINYSFENSKEYELSYKFLEGNNNKKHDGKKKRIYVLQGESILTDKVLETYRILRALEDAIIQTRMGKSKMVKIVTVDVSRLSDNEKSKALVDYVNSKISYNERIGDTTYDRTSLQSEPVIITIPIKNGVGDVNIKEFTDNANIKDIVDLEYFQNKLFAGLRTPREYFNFGESMPGVGASGASLVRIDIRYARAVKKIQRVILLGIKEMIKLFNHYNNIEEENAPKVSAKIVRVSTAEDEERFIEMQERMNTASQIIEAVSDPETGGISMEKVNLFIKFFTTVAPSTALVAFLNELKSKKDIASKPQDIKIA